ncbi:hypothetical protein [Streptomyces smaragdinus]|nr:hypothetical protein [Streptomyces smaragdinus]
MTSPNVPKPRPGPGEAGVVTAAVAARAHAVIEARTAIGKILLRPAA